ncbi:MAG: DNA translocase FtsK [Spirochaetaceae bacterium]|nr:DNA translocase FtsK [Spirochaetaceae bacterium]
MFKNKKQTIVALVIAVIAIYLFLAIFSAKSGASTVLYTGSFLYNYYFDSAFYIPVYLFVCVFLLLKEKFNRNNVILLISTILPFLTISLALRLLYVKTSLSAVEKALLNSFGLFAPFVLFLLTIAELFVIVRLGFFMHLRRKMQDAAEDSSEDYSQKSSVENQEPALQDQNSMEDGNDNDPDNTVSDSSPRTKFAELNFNYSPAEYAPPDSESIENKRESELLPIEAPDDIDDEIYSQPAYYRMKKNDEEVKDLSPANDDGLPAIEPDLEEADNQDEEDENENEDLLETESDKDIAKVLTESDDSPIVVREYFASQKKINLKKTSYKIPVDILDEYEEIGFMAIDERTREEAKILKQTLAEFKIEAEVTGIKRGPVITMFEILPAPGVKLSKITNLADNIALRLAASRVRIVAPIPGKHAVGIEVPNRTRAIVSFRELIFEDYPQYSKYHLPVILGKDITGEEQIIDLTQTPHLLIAGATGSGKSVCVNSIIVSLLYNKKPQEVRMILIDPKIVELKLYNDIPHLLTPVITDSKKAFQALQYCIYEMEKRYALLDALGVKDVHSFNKKIKSNKIATMPLPYIVVIIDEFADLMATTGKELESTVARLAAMSRAVGIHLVLATQRPSIDVITGLIKANIPSRIAFMVASKTDSRIIIDSVGAEMLLGKGDMLFTSSWNPYLTRIQGAYLSENEAERVVEKVKEYGEPEYIDDEIFIDDEDEDASIYENDYGEDPLMDKALEVVSVAGKASASYLQRRLKIGYNRAARLVEEMERRGIVGPQNGSKPRDILNIPGNRKD